MQPLYRRRLPHQVIRNASCSRNTYPKHLQGLVPTEELLVKELANFMAKLPLDSHPQEVLRGILIFLEPPNPGQAVEMFVARSSNEPTLCFPKKRSFLTYENRG